MALRAASTRSATKISTRASRTRMVVRAESENLSNREMEVRAYVTSLPGVSAPFPDVFDPLGLAKTASVVDVKRWRESEITHGRISMLAVVGFLVGENLEDFPAFMNFDGDITGPAINQFQQVRTGFWEPLALVVGILEAYRVALGWETPKGAAFNTLKPDYEPGFLGFDPLGLLPKDDPAALKDMQTKELNNGRLAMIAIAAFVVQEEIAGTGIFEHTLLKLEKEAILEIDDVEKIVGAPLTKVPEALQKL